MNLSAKFLIYCTSIFTTEGGVFHKNVFSPFLFIIILFLFFYFFATKILTIFSYQFPNKKERQTNRMSLHKEDLKLQKK